MNNSAPDYQGKRIFHISGFGSVEDREENMRACLAHGFPAMKQIPMHEGRLSIVCFGPSLKYTWSRIRRPILTVSGSHDFLISGGIVPDFHVECDPRKHKTYFTRNPQAETRYLMASVCHPDMWENMKKANCEVWHSVESKKTIKWVSENDPGGLLIGGGSNVGMRSIEVAGMLGYHKFDIYGMDFSFDDQRHAGFHPNEIEDEILITLNNRDFRTTRQLYEGAREFIQMASHFDCEWTLHGDGLLQEMVATLKQLRSDNRGNQRRASNLS